MRHCSPGLATAVILAAASAPLSAAEIVIGAGSETGEYAETIVPAINQMLIQSGDYTAKPALTAGSQDTLERMQAGELPAGVTQLDVLAMTMAESLGPARVQLVGRIAPEALLCAARKGGRVRSYYNLTDVHERPLVVSAGSRTSGSALTLQYIIDNDPELDDSKVQLVYNDNIVAELDRLATGNRDLVCFVTMPDPGAPLISRVTEDEELFFIDFASRNALDIRVNGEPLYETMDVMVDEGILGVGAEEVTTVITWAGLVVAPNADPAMVEALSQAIANPELLPPTTTAGKARRMWDDFAESATEFAGEAKDTAIEWTGTAIEKAGEVTESIRRSFEDSEQ